VPRRANASDHRRLTVGGADAELDSRLSAELDAHNFAGSGQSDLCELTVEDETGELVAMRSG